MAVKSNEEDEPEDQVVPVLAVESLRTRPSLTDCRRLLGTLAGGFVLSKRGLGTNPLRPEEKVLVFRIMMMMMRGWGKSIVLRDCENWGADCTTQYHHVTIIHSCHQSVKERSCLRCHIDPTHDFVSMTIA
jgi:hypothetical protein